MIALAVGCVTKGRSDLYKTDQFWQVTHPTSLGNQIAIALPVPSPVAEEGRSPFPYHPQSHKNREPFI